jgi:hypothetical protein
MAMTALHGRRGKEESKMTERKIVQFQIIPKLDDEWGAYDVLYALADDGTMWLIDDVGDEWMQWPHALPDRDV